MGAIRRDEDLHDSVLAFAERAQRLKSGRQRTPNVEADAPTHNLPLQPGALLGRERELDTIHEQLSRDDVPLLTLTGPGGVGKSRLAVEAAQQDVAAFPDGVRLVDLALLDDREQPLAAIADVLGLQDAGTLTLLETLKRYIGTRAMLLVLDNCERVVSACAAIGDLLGACPGLKVIATSQEPLRLRCEHVMSVHPLALPDCTGLTPSEAIAASPSVALFVRRAQATRLDFHLTEENLIGVAALCARLDGLPLAIELAAAQTNILSPAAIERRVEAETIVLKDRVLDVPARQQSMDDTIAWSHSLLEETHRTLLNQLSVFAGGFTLDAAHAVAASDTDPLAVLAGISTLVDKNLVATHVPDRGEPRFSITEQIRRYVLHQLGQGVARSTSQRCHAEYYLALVERAALELNGRAQETWLERLDQEQQNVRAAILWARESGEGDTELRLACCLTGYWWFRGQAREGIERLQSAAAHYSGNNQTLRAQTLNSLAVLLRWIGDYGQADAVLKEVLQLTSQLDDGALTRQASMNLGATYLAAGRFGDARSQLDESLSTYETVGDTWSIGQTMLYLASLDLAEGAISDGETHAAGSLTIFQSLEDTRASAVAFTVLARAAAAQNKRATAFHLLAEGVRLIARLSEYRSICMVVEQTVWMIAAEDATWGAQLLGGAEALRDVTCFARTAYERSLYEQASEELTAQLGEAEIARARLRGHAMRPAQLLSATLTTLESLATPRRDETPKPFHSGRDILSKREDEVLTLVAQGLSNKEIASQLGISQNTVKFHVTSLLNKLGVDSRVHMVAVAAQRQLLRR